MGAAGMTVMQPAYAEVGRSRKGLVSVMGERDLSVTWIPAFAGMTGRGAGMTGRGAGMTVVG